MNSTDPAKNSRTIPQRHIVKAFEYFHGSGSVFELCAIRPKATKHRLWDGYAGGKEKIVAGWYDNPAKALDAASGLDAIGADGIYITLNPCNPALLARASNRLVASVDRTVDHDISRLLWLLVDIDPKRPKGISSSEAEHAFALKHAQDVQQGLLAKGWPEPLYADSGNGAHLIFRLPDLDNNQDNIEILKGALAGLNSLYQIWKDNILLEVDRKVFNPARICKLYGTTTRKGDPSPDRPHRCAKIISFPKEPLPVKIELLSAMANVAKEEGGNTPKGRKAQKTNGSQGKLDVERYLNHFGTEVVCTKMHGESTLYVLRNCLFDPSHNSKEAAIGQTGDGKLFYQCFHDSCSNHTWHDAKAIISGDAPLGEFCTFQNRRPSRTFGTFGGRLGNLANQHKTKGSDVSDVSDVDADADDDHGCFLPPPPTFPLEVLSPQFGRVIEEHSKAYAVPVEIPGCALLSVSGASIGRTRGLLVKPGWIEHGNTWMIIVGVSGIGKSPATSAIHAPVFEFERQWFKEYQEKLKSHREEHSRRDHVQKQDRASLAPPPDPPGWTQLIVDDATPEALATVLAENPRGVLWRRDEIAGLIQDLDRYSRKPTDGGTKARLMSSYDSGPWKITRVSKNLLIPHACLSIFGTIQPQALPTIFTDLDAATGFLPRFIFVRAEQERPPLWSNDVVSQESKEALTHLIAKLLRYQLDANGNPLVIGMQDQARLLYQTWFNEQVMEPWTDVDAHIYQAVLAKLRGQCLRLALILHCMDAAGFNRSEMLPVTEETMEKAIRLANYFKEQQKTCWEFVVNSCAVVQLTPLQRRISQAIVALESEIVSGMLPTARIAECVNRGYDPKFHLSPKAVGKAVHSLGLDTKHLPDKSARGVVISPDVLQNFKHQSKTNVPNVPNVEQKPVYGHSTNVPQTSQTPRADEISQSTPNNSSGRDDALPPFPEQTASWTSNRKSVEL